MTPRPTRRTTSPSPRFRRAAVAALGAPACLAPHAHAIDVTWASPASGQWHVPTNWLPQELAPPSGDEVRAVIGAPSDPAFIVTLSERRDIGGLALEAPLATLHLAEQARLSLGAYGLVNHGLIRIDDRATLMFFRNGTLTPPFGGTGVVRLQGRHAEVGSDAALALQLVAGQSIRGWGKVTAGLAIHGSILADDPAGELVLEGQPKFNYATIGATQGGTLRLNGITLHQSPAASLTALDGGIILLDGATVVGGALTGLGGAIIVQTAGTLDHVALVGDVGIPGGTSLGIVGAALAHTGGTIAVGGGGPVAGLSDFFCYEPLTLSGTGTIDLRPAITPAGLLIQPRVTLGATGAGAAITLADGYSLTGSGVIIGGLRVGTPGTAQSRIDPGTPDTPGLLAINGALELSPTGLARFDGFGPDASDRLTVTGHATILGTITVALAPGAVLPPGTGWVLIEAQSLSTEGATFTLPAQSTSPVPRIVITASTIEFRIPLCSADFDASGTLDPDDLSSYIAAYFSGNSDPAADLNHDGSTDPDDLADMITAYFAGC